MKRNKQSFRAFLDQSFRRFRELPPADVTPGWERILERVREYPEGLSEDMPVSRDSERPVRSMLMRWPVWAAAVVTVIAAVALTMGLWPRNPLAVVENTDGKLYLSLKGTVQALHVGAKLHEGETVFSREGSGTTLRLQDGTLVEMRTNSELSLESADDGLRIQLNNGSVIVNAAKQSAAQHLYVRTKDVTVAVVGTVFLVNTEEQGSRVTVLEGEVRLQQGTSTQRLRPGGQVASNPSMPTIPVREEISWSQNAPAHLALLEQTLAVSAPALSQRPVETLEAFDVASIREDVDGVPTIFGEFRSSGRRAEYESFSIQALVAEAWNIRPDQFALSPGVSPQSVYPMMALGRSARIYDIVAQAPEGTTPTRDEFRTMLQSLLATRFKLATHTEKRDTAVYVLQTNGKPQFKVSAGDGPCRPVYSFAAGGQRIVATHCPILETIRKILFVDRPIYDQTGLTGFYDFEITATPPPHGRDPGAITAFDAVKGLGLKLEAQRLPIDTIVIDHVEAPSEN